VHEPASPIARLFVATSNPGKVEEFRALAASAATSPGKHVAIEMIPGFSALPAFPEAAPTFAENSAGKALYYSRFCEGYVLADDSGLVVPSLGGAPGVQSARYAGAQATNQQRISKLLAALNEVPGRQRDAYFACVLSVARAHSVVAVVSEAVHGQILEAPRGSQGFGYDPVFYDQEFGKSFAELSREEKNQHSHRGKAFRRLLNVLL
jgi:XTP/dITP diphosphohydrolase